jgi:hypothetical protein
MRWASSTGDTFMSKLAALMGFIFLAVSSAWAQTPPATPAPGATPGSPPGDAAAAGGGIADYWWIILVIIVIAAVIYFMRRGRSST